jgi:RNA polymerase sigma-70 factor (ECF subfamily)
LEDAPAQSASEVDAIPARIDLERALATLPHGARTILLLHGVDGYGYREIATALGIDIGTVKSQLHRARRLLLQTLSA